MCFSPGLLGGQAVVPSQPEPAQDGVTTVQPGEDEIPRHAVTLQLVPMSLQDQASHYARDAFSAGSLLIPALPAGINMASPPNHYPREWKDGASAFGRNFGDALAAEEAAKAGKFLACALLHEDPRYFPDTRTNPMHRVFHALAFTLVDSSTTGRRRLAVSNLAGVAAGGFVGTAYLPAGYSDAIHAGQRAGGMLVGYAQTQVVGFATQNVIEEFSPELKALGRLLHLPFVH